MIYRTIKVHVIHGSDNPLIPVEGGKETITL